jgi:hypothetical protein
VQPAAIYSNSANVNQGNQSLYYLSIQGVIMSTKKLIAPILLVALTFSAASYANGNHKGHHKPQPLKGCYQVARGSIKESPANVDVVGVHNLVLVKEGRGRHMQRIEISGPLGGREDRNAHEEEGEEHEEGEEGEEPSERHGQHAFGTFNFSGVLLSYESDSGVTGVECFDPITGIPGLIHGFEVMRFYGGSGAYSGLTEGRVVFEGSFDRCEDPSNPVATFRVSSGEICFAE